VTRVEVSKLVALLFAAFPSARINPGTSAVYERMLADLDSSTAARAVDRLLSTSKFLPTIAEVRAACLELERGTQRPGGDAWGDVREAVHRFGIYRQPVFADPVVARCVESLGWTEICNSEHQASDRARFVELYDRLAGQAQREHQVPEHVRMLPEHVSRGQSALADALSRVLALRAGGDS
jgi:hypothetical protein